MPLDLIHISLASQRLIGLSNGVPLCDFPVSTALNGAGEQDGSGCTPLGRHRVRARIGDGQPLGTVFIGRRPTGEIWSPEFARQHPQRDWILTRILWLCGEQPGFNRGGNRDSQRRYIYLHGTPDDQPMGVALSHGCVRLRNTDMLTLFELTPVGCRVEIHEQAIEPLISSRTPTE
ncbi:L,D-transpeptidase family protein [Halopseudomonas sp.]|uniref:L,D-transpeptidase family protein n=1 Tax=Halopseudomonas sp. TaxID=2901191 RepID=UPI00356312C3